MDDNNNQAKKEKKLKKPKRSKWFFIGFIVGLLFCILAYICVKNDIVASYLSKNKSKSYNISSDIRKMSELVTAELEYQSVIEIKDDNSGKWHAFFTSKEMLLLYKAKISAGIDLTNAEVQNIDNKIIVKIPHASIKHKEIDTNSLKVYNTKLALPLISISDEDLLIDALRLANEDMDQNVNTTNIIEFAEKQAKEVIEQFIHSTIEDVTVQIDFVDDMAANNSDNQTDDNSFITNNSI